MGNEAFGSASELWDRPEMSRQRNARQFEGRWASKKKMLLGAFTEALVAVGFPGAGKASDRALLLASLDLYGCGFISRSDLEWLDAWRPPAWLSAAPDEAAWSQIRSLLLRAHQYPLRAWRRALDTDDSNTVSWVEFRSACAKLGFNGNTAGAWRFLDADLNGNITMREYDEASAELLGSFKSWADWNFGSVEVAFRALDTDGSGTLSYAELRRACQRLKWCGDTRLLFNCLDFDGKRDEVGDNIGKRSISFAEIAFLDAWQPEETEDVEDGLRRRPPSSPPLESEGGPHLVRPTTGASGTPPLPRMHFRGRHRTASTPALRRSAEAAAVSSGTRASSPSPEIAQSRESSMHCSSARSREGRPNTTSCAAVGAAVIANNRLLAVPSRQSAEHRAAKEEVLMRTYSVSSQRMKRNIVSREAPRSIDAHQVSSEPLRRSFMPMRPASSRSQSCGAGSR